MAVRHLYLFLAALAAAGVAAGGLARAQQHDHGAMHGGTQPGAAQHAAPAPEDTRVEVEFPPALKAHTLASMRDHLAALQEIQAALARDDYLAAGRIAEERLGLSSFPLHNADAAAKYMPPGMQEAGGAMHRAASRFALAAQKADVTGELASAVEALAELTAQCVGCHAGYRLR